MRRLARPVLLLAMLAGVSGCATTSTVAASSSVPIIESASPTSSLPSSSPSTSAVVGSVQSTDKSFSIVLPTGWKQTKPGTDQVFAAKAPSANDTVVSTINVLVTTPTTMPNLDDVISSGEVQMRQQGGSVSPLPARTIGGASAEGYSVDRTTDGAQITQVQYFVIHGSSILTVTTTASTSQKAQLTQLTGGILDTWAWSS